MKWTTISILFFLSLVACRTNTVYVPVESLKVEYRDNFMRDSIFLRDSIFMQMKGDTVFFEKYRYFYKDKIVRDSVFVTDSIQIPYPVEVVKEVNRLKWWQEILIYSGIFALALFCYRIYAIFK